MAEKGAHLTGTTLIRPSIFEIVAQKSFASTVEPAFKKIISCIASFNPQRYGHLLKWTDEGYLMFNIILQRYYFNKYSASFSEAFYGLRRVATVNPDVKSKLSNEQKTLSLITTVLCPYIKNKLSQLSERYTIEKQNGIGSKSKWEKIYYNFIIKGHTIIFMIYEFVVLYNYIRYISGRSEYTSPLLRLLSITLTYAQSQPVISVSDLLRKISNNSFNLNDGVDILQRAVTTSLELGAFFLQFLSWWTEENYSINVMSLPIPPPPEVPEVAKYYKGICPICCKRFRIHTVLPTSGYVFCYQCILPVIRKYGKCPVTKYPAKEDDLIRLYMD